MEGIESINPEEWTQSEVSQWLKLTHDGDLSDLVAPFRVNKISGLTLVRLTNEDLKSKLGIKQFGLRDAFISARDQVVQGYVTRQQNASIYLSSLDKLGPLNTTINKEEENEGEGGDEEKQYHESMQYHSNHSNNTLSVYGKIPSSSQSNQSKTQSEYYASDEFLQTKYSNSSKDALNTSHYGPAISASQSPISPSHSPDNHPFGYNEGQNMDTSPPHDNSNNNNIDNTNNYIATSSDIIFTNQTYLYVDLCRILINGYCRFVSQYINYQQWNTLNSIIFNFYFEYERHVEQFGHDLWKTLVVIEIATIENQQTGTTIRGFTGYRLIKHIKQYLQRYTMNKNDRDLELLCMALIKYEYIRLAAIQDDNKRLLQYLTEKDKHDYQRNIFVNSKQYVYQFENEKHREFIKSDEPDRQSWYKTCSVQIYSSTLNKWTTGTVVDIEKDSITIQYGEEQQMRKVVDRYQDNIIKSTPQFIYTRKNWIRDSQLEVFSNRYKTWYLGRIGEILQGDILKVF